jgi:hypothetical protein
MAIEDANMSHKLVLLSSVVLASRMLAGARPAEKHAAQTDGDAGSGPDSTPGPGPGASNHSRGNLGSRVARPKRRNQLRFALLGGALAVIGVAVHMLTRAVG